MVQIFEYSKLFLQLERSCKLDNSLDNFKVTLDNCTDHTDDGIHSDHTYLDNLGIPLNSTLNKSSNFPKWLDQIQEKVVLCTELCPTLAWVSPLQTFDICKSLWCKWLFDERWPDSVTDNVIMHTPLMPPSLSLAIHWPFIISNTTLREKRVLTNSSFSDWRTDMSPLSPLDGIWQCVGNYDPVHYRCHG